MFYHWALQTIHLLVNIRSVRNETRLWDSSLNDTLKKGHYFISEMLKNCGAVFQALIGTIFTWGVTAAGAGMVVFFQGTQVRIVIC